MAAPPHTKMNVLVVDDFNSFRNTLIKIMHELGFRRVDSVHNGSEALSYCEKHHYDIILSDYNLGKGKNGQQLLEELRLKGLLKLDDIFILLSADTSRQVVLSAYDSEPDAYLTKPITMKVIQQRLNRLLNQREEMLEINAAISKKDFDTAILLLQDKIQHNSRYSLECRKLLASVFMQTSKWGEAEQIFRDVLEMRPLDWAQVGLAEVKIAQGEFKKAEKWLQDIVSVKPNCMKAYDALVKAQNSLEEPELAQKTLETAVEISPMSVNRQKQLAEIAMENGDTEVAAQAYRKTVRHGAHSHHDTLDNQINYAKAVAHFYDSDPSKASELVKEGIKMLNIVEERFPVTLDEKLVLQLLNSQMQAYGGDRKKALEMLEDATSKLSKLDGMGIDVEVEFVNSLLANNEHEKAQKKIAELLSKYKNDQNALEKLDPFLFEPISEKGKQKLFRANKKGIDAYKLSQFDKAVASFSGLEKRYPRYIGVKLNLAQALIGRIRQAEDKTADIKRCESLFKTVKRYLNNNDQQYSRFAQLQDMLRVAASSN